MTHFICGLIAGPDAHRHCAWVTRICRRVVVMKPHGDERVFRKKNRSAVRVDTLPGGIPGGNADQLPPRSVRQNGKGFEQFAEVVSVWINGEDINIERQPEIVANQEIPRSRWYV